MSPVDSPCLNMSWMNTYSCWDSMRECMNRIKQVWHRLEKTTRSCFTLLAVRVKDNTSNWSSCVCRQGYPVCKGIQSNWQSFYSDAKYKQTPPVEKNQHEQTNMPQDQRGCSNGISVGGRFKPLFNLHNYLFFKVIFYLSLNLSNRFGIADLIRTCKIWPWCMTPRHNYPNLYCVHNIS